MKSTLHVLLAAAALLVASWSPVYAQGLPPAPPDALGFSVERLERLDRHLQEQVEQGELPGAVALVARNGKIAYLEAFGEADREAGRPMRTDALFRIASMTKPVVSVAVMMLYEEGRFLLNDPVANYIPEFDDAQVLVSVDLRDTTWTTEPAKRRVTIRDLLTHTSGISYGIFDERMQPVYDKYGVPAAWTREPLVLADQMRILADLPLANQPGERFRYGMSTDMLGYLVEVVSGMPLDRFLEERIFEPLGMHDTAFYLQPEQVDRLVTVYRKTDDGALVPRSGEPDYPFDGAQTYFSGGGGLVSSIDDYARFLQMLLNGGELDGVRLLGPKAVALMTADHLGAVSPWRGRGFGLGFQVLTDVGAAGELGSVGRYGWSGYWGTYFWVDPEEDFFAILMSQIQPNPYDARRFEVLVYQALVGTTETKLSSAR